jgi:hypothetical protein
MAKSYAYRHRGVLDVADLHGEGLNARWRTKLWSRMQAASEQIHMGGSGRGVYTPQLDGMIKEYDEKLVGDIVDILVEEGWISDMGPEGKAIADFIANPAGRSKKELNVLKQRFIDSNRVNLHGGTRQERIVESIDILRDPYPEGMYDEMYTRIGHANREEAAEAIIPDVIDRWRQRNEVPSHLEEQAWDQWRSAEEVDIREQVLPDRYESEAHEVSSAYNSALRTYEDAIGRGGDEDAAMEALQETMESIESEIYNYTGLEGWADPDAVAMIARRQWDELELFDEDLFRMVDRDNAAIGMGPFEERFVEESLDWRGTDDVERYLRNSEGPEDLMDYLDVEEVRQAAREEILDTGNWDDQLEESLSSFENVEEMRANLQDLNSMVEMIRFDNLQRLADELVARGGDLIPGQYTSPRTAYRAVIEFFGRDNVTKWFDELVPARMDGEPGQYIVGRARIQDVPQLYDQRFPFIRLTEKMREDIGDHGVSLYQRRDGAVKGAAEFLDDGRALIHTFQSADISTIIHESAHVFIPALPDDELRVLADWAGVSPEMLRARTPLQIKAHRGADRTRWRAAQEKLAKAFERYVREGRAPTEGLRGLFQKFRRWLHRIYESIRGPDIPENVTQVFDKMFTPGALADGHKLPELVTGPTGRRLNVEQVAEMRVAQQKLEALPEELLDTVRQGPPKPQRPDYLPQQWSDEAIEARELANMKAFVGDEPEVFRKDMGQATVKGEGIPRSNVFARERTLEKEDFVETVTDAVALAKESGAPIKPGTHGVEMNAAKLIRRRMEAHARSIEGVRLRRKANLRMGGKEGYRLAALGDSRLASREIEIRDRVFHDWMKQGGNKVTPRVGVMESLAWWNRNIFKKYVTIGVGPVPHPAFHVRNTISGLWMAAADPRIGLDPIHGIKHVTDAIFGAFERVPGLGRAFPRSQMRRIMRGEATDELVKGLEDLGVTEKYLRDVAEQLGVVRNNYVREEGMLNSLHAAFPEGVKGTAKRSWDVIKKRLIGSELPAEIMEAIEDGMRLNAYVKALQNGLDFRQAAQAVRDAFIDYSIVSDAHRTLRDLVPFAQFSIGMLPQTAKALGRRPRITAPIRAAMSSREEEGDSRMLPDYVRQQAHLPWGRDREGNAAYMVGLATPFEDPISAVGAAVPGKGWGRRAQNLIARSHPLIKGGVESAFGVNTFFGTPIDSYRRDTPVARMLPDKVVGRKERFVTDPKTGEKESISEVSPGFHRFMSFTPFSRATSTVNALLDERKDMVAKIISTMTGAKVVSVDKQREMRRLIGRYLEQRASEGDVGVFKRFFQRGEVDPQLEAAIRMYAGG